MAFVVIDTWQGRGVGSILMRHLVKFANEAGLQELTAEVLPENKRDEKGIRKIRLQARRAPRPADTPPRAEARLERALGSPAQAYLKPKGERR
jgi:GNAT superfamily N-acetyltransferase